jgi:hypothetical protein
LKYHPKHVEQFPDINKPCNVASCWTYIGILLGAHPILHISRIKVKAQRIKRLGHIQRMDQTRPTRKLLDWKPMGTRPVGRPRQRWQKDVMEDLKKLKIKNWKEAAKDRRTRRDLAEKAKTHKGL